MFRPTFAVATVSTADAKISLPEAPYLVWLQTVKGGYRQPDTIVGIPATSNSEITPLGAYFTKLDAASNGYIHLGAVHDTHTSSSATVSVQVSGVVEDNLNGKSSTLRALQLRAA